MFGDPAVYRRRQRRRAIIAWTVGTATLVLIVLASILGGGKHEDEPQPPSPFGYSMSSAQYEGLDRGLDETAFVNRLEQTGLPENLTQGRFVELFPPHAEDVSCSYWEISDQLEEVARICFDSGGHLVQKLQRSAGGEEFGVTA